jgi:hypothetical protein
LALWQQQQGQQELVHPFVSWAFLLLEPPQEPPGLPEHSPDPEPDVAGTQAYSVVREFARGALQGLAEEEMEE